MKFSTNFQKLMNEKERELCDAKIGLDIIEQRIKECVRPNEINGLLATRVMLENQIIDLYNELLTIKQEKCLHPLWYMYEKDFEYGIHSYKCKCVECGLKMGALVEEFGDRVLSKEDIAKKEYLQKSAYFQLRDKYNFFRQTFDEHDAAKRTLKIYKNI